VSQLIGVNVDILLPLKSRVVMIDVFGFDDSDANGDLVVKVNSCKRATYFWACRYRHPLIRIYYDLNFQVDFYSGKIQIRILKEMKKKIMMKMNVF